MTPHLNEELYAMIPCCRNRVYTFAFAFPHPGASVHAWQSWHMFKFKASLRQVGWFHHAKVHLGACLVLVSSYMAELVVMWAAIWITYPSCHEYRAMHNETIIPRSQFFGTESANQCKAKKTRIFQQHLLTQTTPKWSWSLTLVVIRFPP